MQDRVIVALDVPDLTAMERFLDALEGRPAFYKVGLELFVAEGARAVDAVKRRGGKVFLDLKLHDIPETVARATATATRLGVDLLTVHASGGREMLARAVDAAAGQVRVIAVTVLTSLTAEDLRREGNEASVADTVVARARVAVDAGVAGLVCSPEEVAAVRTVAPELLRVVPGIRPAGSAAGDQKRTGTPASAIADGATHLVVGRPVRDAARPGEAFDGIVAEVAAALA